MRRAFEVRIPPQAAFSFFSDPNLAFERMASQFRVVWLDPIAGGSRFRLEAPNPRDICEGLVESYEPPNRLVFRIWPRDHPDRAGVAAYQFVPTPGGTRVVGSGVTQMGPILQLAAAVLKPLLAVVARRGERRLIQAAESAYQSGRLTGT
jgi:uncharacterized protein YndB with AHSA1/START domain